MLVRQLFLVIFEYGSKLCGKVIITVAVCFWSLQKQFQSGYHFKQTLLWLKIVVLSSQLCNFSIILSV